MRLQFGSICSRTASFFLKTGFPENRDHPCNSGFGDGSTTMANHVSALKRARQTVTRTEVNRANRSRVRSSLRSLREALAKGDVKEAQAQYRATVSALDKSVQKGSLHSNTVSRYKSRLNTRLKALATAKKAK
jgi:small subunit ribosomal protein S20